MFERTRNYPTAMTDPDGDADQAMRDAVTWFVEQCQAIAGQPLLVVNRRGDEQNDPLLASLAEKVKVETPRTLLGSRWSGGPSSSHGRPRTPWPPSPDDRRTKVLMVLSWTARDVDAWAAAAQPKMLTAGTSGPAAVALADPVVEQGLITLTHSVNHANNLAGALDKRDAIAVLLTLHDGRHRLEAKPIYAWALANGWPARGAQRLRELAEKIVGGTRPRLQGGSPFRPDTLQQWRDAVAGSSS
jgi:hypothetical protein